MFRKLLNNDGEEKTLGPDEPGAVQPLLSREGTASHHKAAGEEVHMEPEDEAVLWQDCI